MIDLHCHFLPGIDDGANTMEEALALARAAVDNGIRCAIMTPHLHPGRHENTRAGIAEHTGQFRAALKQADIPLRVGFAAEVRLAPETLPLIESGQVPFLGQLDGYNIMLLEFPHSHIPPGADKLVERLLDKKIRPMIAHPERNKDVMRNISKIQPFIDMGCILQLTAASIANRFGDKAHAQAVQLLRSDAQIVIATDAHNLKARPPLLKEGMEAAAKIVGHEAAFDMVNHLPMAIVSSQFTRSRSVGSQAGQVRREAEKVKAKVKVKSIPFTAVPPKPARAQVAQLRAQMQESATPESLPARTHATGRTHEFSTWEQADRSATQAPGHSAAHSATHSSALSSTSATLEHEQPNPKIANITAAVQSFMLERERPGFMDDIERSFYNLSEKELDFKIQRKLDAELPGAIQGFLKERLMMDLEKELIPAMRNSFSDSLQQDLARRLQQVLTLDVRNSLIASIIQEARNEAYNEFRNRFKHTLQQSLIEELIALLKLVDNVEDTNGLIAHLQQVGNEKT